MIRRALGCLSGCAALVVGVGLFAALVAFAPAITRAIPQVREAVSREAAALQKELSQATAPQHLPSTPAPLPGGFTPPSASDCQWAEGILLEDRTLDLQAVSTYPQVAPWYQQTAGWWGSAYTDLQGLCGAGGPPSSQACAADLAHFQQAYSTHQSAAGSAGSTGVPDNTQADQAWNATWMANYQRLESIWAATGCGSG